uniref:Uncharacterized protein n=1 Tax=Nelumbo nucifera TaxID=4432 RepID=A0A822YHQ2_NELNU|nr:TPA_asm: hypothetical protein HUJ06_009356 [Nelumbo nucifera]
MVDEENCVFFLPHRPRSQICELPFFLFMKGTGKWSFIIITIQYMHVILCMTFHCNNFTIFFWTEASGPCAYDFYHLRDVT